MLAVEFEYQAMIDESLAIFMLIVIMSPFSNALGSHVTGYVFPTVFTLPLVGLQKGEKPDALASSVLHSKLLSPFEGAEGAALAIVVEDTVSEGAALAVGVEDTVSEGPAVIEEVAEGVAVVSTDAVDDTDSVFDEITVLDSVSARITIS